MQAVHAVVHTREQAEQIVREAMQIAEEWEGNTIKWANVFNKACELLGQRATAFAQPQAVPLDLTTLRGKVPA